MSCNALAPPPTPPPLLTPAQCRKRDAQPARTMVPVPRSAFEGDKPNTNRRLSIIYLSVYLSFYLSNVPAQVKLIDLGMAVVSPSAHPASSAPTSAAQQCTETQSKGKDQQQVQVKPCPRPKRSRHVERGCLGSPGFIAPEVVRGGAC